MLRHIRKRELEQKLQTFKKILVQATSIEERESAQEYISKYETELKKLELPDECFRV
jgi:hypothetical protein